MEASGAPGGLGRHTWGNPRPAASTGKSSLLICFPHLVSCLAWHSTSQCVEEAGNLVARVAELPEFLVFCTADPLGLRGEPLYGRRGQRSQSGLQPSASHCGRHPSHQAPCPPLHVCLPLLSLSGIPWLKPDSSLQFSSQEGV